MTSEQSVFLAAKKNFVQWRLCQFRVNNAVHCLAQASLCLPCGDGAHVKESETACVVRKKDVCRENMSNFVPCLALPTDPCRPHQGQKRRPKGELSTLFKRFHRGDSPKLGCFMTCSAKNTRTRMNSDMQPVEDDVPNDLSRLPSLEEDRVRHALELRFQANKIYTHINSLLGAQRTTQAAAPCALHLTVRATWLPFACVCDLALLSIIASIENASPQANQQQLQREGETNSCTTRQQRIDQAG